MAKKQGLLSRTAGRLVLALIVALAALILGPASAALAQAPQLTIETPEGSPTGNPTPQMRGTTDDPFDEVTVVIERVGGGGGATLTAGPVGKEWSVSPATSLPDGNYTARASQTNTAEEEGQSGSVGFTIDTSPPTVVLNQPASPSNKTKPTFSGTASDTEPVTVEIFKAGTKVASASASGTGGGWSTNNESSLTSGTYSAVAKQASSLGNSPGVSGQVEFTIDTNSPTVVLNQPASPSNNTKPTFGGTASDSTEVVVEIFEGGSKVASATASGNGGGWSTSNETSLGTGSYTAVATQASSLGNPRGKSNQVAFTIDTNKPTVVLNQPATPSKNTVPSFTGTATDTTPVVVHIKKEGTEGEVSSATATGTGTTWTSTAASPPLSEGVYTAIATQASSLGNEAGTSPPVTFTVHTAPPVVTLQQPVSPSKNTKPTFAGAASDSTSVVVHILDSNEKAVATATATPLNGSWVSSAASPALTTGHYTAFATEASSLGNPEGSSERVSFAIDTNPPTVKLHQPLTHSNNAKPTFTGTASDTTVVTVQVYLGTKVAGSPVATATALPAAEAWTSGPAKPELLPGKHIYTAVASQPSSLGNPPGASAPMTFAVDTQAPSVTLNTPASPSNDATPSFTGTASEATEQILVKIHRGSEISNEVVATATASGTGGGWTTGPASATLPDGEYVAVASQLSAFPGIEPGEAESAPFVVDTVPPQVTLSRPSAGSSSSGSTQLVEGTAGTAVGDRAQVTVQLFTGSQIAAGQSPAQSVQVPANGGHWAATLAGLSPGSYVVRAEQADDAGNVGVSAATSFSVLASAAAAQAGPSASFTWSPSAPHVGEMVSLLSNSTDPASPITAFAWDLSGTGVFAGGGAVSGTSFSTTGQHVVRLRVTDAAGVSAVAAETIDVAASSLRLMHPFPTVRIAARGAGAGIRLTLLSVRAPAGARIAVGCSGKGCPVKSQSRIAAAGKPGPAPLQFRRFQRFLRPGVVLQIRISKPGEIGKYTRFVVRRGRLPARSDACIASAAGKPIPCPSS